jgi:ketosteroid isomerase-like protein
VTNREIVEAYIAGVRAGDVEALVSLFGDDAEVHMPSHDEPLRGKDELRAFYSDLIGRWTSAIDPVVHAIAVDGDVGMFEFTLTITLPDGGRYVAASVDVFHMRGGLIRRLQAYTDGLSLRDALGLD